jgi:catalase
MVHVFIVTALTLSLSAMAGISKDFEEYEGGSEATERVLVDRLLKNFVVVQAAGATKGKLNRGTHSKGVCAKGELEIEDIAKANPTASKETVESVSKGLFASAGKYPVPFLRFANGKSVIGKDTDPDVRAISFSVDLGKKGRQEFSMNSVTIFPVESLTAFNLFLEAEIKPALAGKAAAAKETDPAKAAEVGKAVAAEALKKYLAGLTAEEKQILARAKALRDQVTSQGAASYRQKEYWSGTAFKLGDSIAAKTWLVPCDGVTDHTTPPGAKEDFLQEEFKSYISDKKNDAICFNMYVQPLDSKKMELNGKKYSQKEWVENATLDWDAAGVDAYQVATLTIDQDSLLSDADCNDPKNAIDVSTNSLPEHAPLGRINRARSFVEQQSKTLRSGK